MTMDRPSAETSLLLQLVEQGTELSRQMGVIAGQNNIIIAEQNRAAAGRKETHDRLRAVEAKVGSAAGNIDRIAPLVDKHEQLHQRSLGAIWFGRFLWTVLAGIAGYIAALIGIKFGGH
ncbi:hypothetical protein ACWX0K_11040 [Nitrobacteraceae bacterium UC4446_H13]